MTPEQRTAYAAILRNPPYEEDRNFLYNTEVSLSVPETAPIGDRSELKYKETKCVCSVGAIYTAKIKDIFTFTGVNRPQTDRCCVELNITNQEKNTLLLLNLHGGFAAVAEWLETGLVPPEFIYCLEP